MTCAETPSSGRSISPGQRVGCLEYGLVEIAHAGRECIGIGSQTELSAGGLRAPSWRICERAIGRRREPVHGRCVLQKAIHALLMRHIRRIEAHRAAADTARSGK